MEAQFGALDGVVHTYVGYAGGTTDNPTYNNIGDHAETAKVIYDPDKISYQDLVDYYIENTSSNVRPTSGQYRYIVFYANEKQEEYIKELAQKRKEEDNLFFSPEKLEKFYLAEDYHQKYQLRTSNQLYQKTLSLFDDEETLIDSHLAAKLNAYRSGFITAEEMIEILESSYLAPIYPEQIQSIKDFITD